ncbi:unnamed protein product [Closterium sp. NIES-54]
MEDDGLHDECSPLIRSPVSSRQSPDHVGRSSRDCCDLARTPIEPLLEPWDPRSDTTATVSDSCTTGSTIGCHVAQPFTGPSACPDHGSLAVLDDLDPQEASTKGEQPGRWPWAWLPVWIGRDSDTAIGRTTGSSSGSSTVTDTGTTTGTTTIEYTTGTTTGTIAGSGGLCAWDEWRWVYSRDGLKALALGQLMSLLLTVTATCSALLAARGVSIPTTQSLLNYVLLAAVYGAVLLHRKAPLTVPWRVLLLASFLDVEGNYFVVLAFRFTSLTRVTLLDCWAIPAAMLLAALCLSTRYHASHVIGALLCTAGLAMLLLSDAGPSKHGGSTATGSSSNATLGNVLVLLGATLYAASNVTVEYLAHRVETTELLAFIGCAGSLISFTQL